MISVWTAALVAIAVFVVPGAVIGWCAGLRVPWAVAASVPVTAAVGPREQHDRAEREEDPGRRGGRRGWR